MATVPPTPGKKPATPPPGGGIGGIVFARVFDLQAQARRSLWRAIAFACPEFGKAVHNSAPLQVEQMVDAGVTVSKYTRTVSDYAVLGRVSRGDVPAPASVMCRFTAGADIVVTCSTSSHWMFAQRTYLMCTVMRGDSDTLQPLGTFCLVAEHDQLPRAFV